MSKQRLALLLSGLALLSLFLAACGGGEGGGTATAGPSGSTPAPATGKAKLGGTIKEPKENAYAKIDPHTTGDSPVFMVTDRVYSRLLRTDPNLNLVPDLAKKWEISDDGLTYTFYLNEGVKWHNMPPVNGRELTSEDIKYSLERISRTDDATFIFAKYFTKVDHAKTELPDKYTIKIRLTAPDAEFLRVVAYGQGLNIVPKELVDAQKPAPSGSKYIDDVAIGTGPFMLVEYSANDFSKLKKNPDYFKKDKDGNRLPYVDGIETRIIPDNATTIAALRTGQLDYGGMMVQGNFTWPQVQELTKNPKLKVIETMVTTWNWVRFQTEIPPFNDARVRRAVHLAIDRQDLANKLAFGKAVPNPPAIIAAWKDYAIPQGELSKLPGYRTPKDQDYAEAKKLLAEAGYPNGLKTQFYTISAWQEWVEMATAVVDQIKRVGIDAELKVMEYPGGWQGVMNVAGKEWYMSLSIPPPKPHPFSQAFDFHSTSRANRFPGGGNNPRFSDAKLDKMLDDLKSTTAEADQKKKARELEMYWLEVMPLVPLNSRYDYWVYWDHLKNFRPGYNWNFWQIEEAWIDK